MPGFERLLNRSENVLNIWPRALISAFVPLFFLNSRDNF